MPCSPEIKMTDLILITAGIASLTFIIAFLVASMIKLLIFLINTIKKRKEEIADFKEQLGVLQNKAKSMDEDAEILAAIGTALHLYLNDTEQEEKTILTIKKVMRPYSPWSSKIYGINQLRK